MTPEHLKSTDRIRFSEHIEPIMHLLFAAIVFFTLLLVAISKWSPNDGQTFQVISGLLTGFSGVFFGRLKPSSSEAKKPDSVVTPEVKS